MMNIVLLEPEMPANTGNIGRTCVATGTRLHLIEPMGFKINDKTVKRAGLDYWDDLDVTIYDDFKDFDLDMIKASYAISEVCDYFKQNNIESYIINEGGNVITGDSYDDDKYTVSLSKYDSEEVLDIVLLENKSLYTLNKSDEITEYSVNPKTSETVDNFDSVSVIANDNLTADMLVRTLFLMNEDEGRKYIENFNAEALWQKGDEISMTNGFKNYLQK